MKKSIKIMILGIFLSRFITGVEGQQIMIHSFVASKGFSVSNIFEIAGDIKIDAAEALSFKDLIEESLIQRVGLERAVATYA